MKILKFAVALVLSSAAFAGCGKENRFSFPPLTAEEKALARETPFEDQGRNADPVGLWMSTVTVQGQPAFQAFEAFTGEGLEFLNDNGSPLSGNVCFGVWSAKGRTIQVYHPSWSYDEAGNLIGTLVIKSTIVLDPGGNTYKGTVTAEAFDLNGHSQGVVLTGTLTGKRITI